MRKVLITSALLMCSCSAAAIPVTWTIENATFTDGTSLTGSFDFDADTNTYSNIFIETESSDFLLPVDYTDAYFSDGSTTSLQLSWIISGTVVQVLNLDFSTNLTNAGGNIGISISSFELQPIDGDERLVSGGTVSAVPVPAAAWLFGSALAGLGWLRRRQAA